MDCNALLQHEKKRILLNNEKKRIIDCVNNTSEISHGIFLDDIGGRDK